MKKTLFGVLAILLVLTMVFGGTLMLSADEPASPNAGTIKDATGIVVDGKMDDAYAQSVKLPLSTVYGTAYDGIYTRGVAYALWSSAENAIYFYVIVNDIDVSAPRSLLDWELDGVELFVKRGNDMKLDYTVHLDEANIKPEHWAFLKDGNWGDNHRGRQYRISGYDGAVTAFCEAEMAIEYTSYKFDDGLGRLTNKSTKYQGDKALVGDTWNEFGWEAGGWAQESFETTAGGSAGYAVEYKINFDNNATPLAAGEKIKFDIAIVDQYMSPTGGAADAGYIWYGSAFRRNNPSGRGVQSPTGHDRLPNYDYLELSAEKVNVAKSYSQEELTSLNLGREDAMNPGADSSKPAYKKTSPVVMVREPGNAPGAPTSNSGGTSTTPADNNPSNPGDGGEGGGCGSSILLGSSAAMLALVGAAGAFAFRKRDEE